MTKQIRITFSRCYFIGLVLLGLVYSFTDSQAKTSASGTEEYVTVVYQPSGRDIQIYYGGSKFENIPAKEKYLSHNEVMDVFNKLNAEGYTLVSTTSYVEAGSRVMCFFKKQK